MYKVVAERKSD